MTTFPVNSYPETITDEASNEVLRNHNHDICDRAFIVETRVGIKFKKILRDTNRTPKQNEYIQQIIKLLEKNK